MSVRFLRWAAARHYRKLGYRVSIKPIHVGNAEIDGDAVNGYERIGIELKSSHDDIVRGIGQCVEALAAGYSKAVIVTTARRAQKLNLASFRKYGISLLVANTSTGEISSR